MATQNHDTSAVALAGKLKAFLEAQAASEVEISGIAPLAGGASCSSYALDLRVKEGAQGGCYRCVLRLALGGRIFATALDRAAEFEVLKTLHDRGLRVPRVFWLCRDPGVLGRDFFLMERVEGETIGRRIVSRGELASARELLPAQLGEELARLHAIDPEQLPFLPRPAAGEAPAWAVLRRCRDELELIGEAHPALEIAWNWLRERRPPCPRPVLLHGDYRMGNLVVGAEGLRAVLDWEFCAAGDPHEDLAWPFVRDWRFGMDARRFAGISDGEDFLAAYERSSGRKVDRRSLRYWEIFGNFRWALGCLTQAKRHLSGLEPSIELASLGRRCAEMELEALLLIEAWDGD